MQLREYIHHHPHRRAVIRELADHLGLASTSSIDHWLAGIRKVPVAHVAGIVEFSRGQVQPVELRPDVDLFHKIGKVA